MHKSHQLYYRTVISHRGLAENFDVSLSNNVFPPAWASAAVDGPFAVALVPTGTRRSWTTPPWTVRRPGTIRGKRAPACGDVTFDKRDLGVDVGVTLQPLYTVQIVNCFPDKIEAGELFTFFCHRVVCNQFRILIILINQWCHKYWIKAGTHYPYVRAVRTARTYRTYGRFLRPYVPVRTGHIRPIRTHTYGPYGKRMEKSIACDAFLPVQPVRTSGVYGTPVYVARNVISI